jgi:hypothetical protein
VAKVKAKKAAKMKDPIEESLDDEEEREEVFTLRRIGTRSQT